MLGLACATPKPVVTEPPKEAAPPPRAAPVIEQEFGSIDPDEVEKTFKRQGGALESCHTEGRGRVPYMAGDMKIFLRIDKTGHVRYGYFEESSLGDRGTEQCILTMLGKVDFPVPIGGEAEVRHAFGWEGGQERAPGLFDPEKVQKALAAQAAIKSRAEQCRKGMRGQIMLTGYVEAGPPGKTKGKGKGKLGHFSALGASATTPEAAEKIDCLVTTLLELPLPTPGSYAAKVTFRL